MTDHPLATDEQRTRLRSFYRNQLLDNVIPFWFPRCIDQQCGGYLHCVDRDGSIVDTDKSVWAQGRMSWMMFQLYALVDDRSEWLEWGEHGLKFLERFGFDQDSRMFFHLSREGNPIRKRRYAYSESFAAVAFAAHYRVTGKESSADRARALFEQFCDWNFTPGKMPPKYTDARPMIGLAPRMIVIATAQELRANMGNDPKWNAVIDRAIEEIATLFWQPEFNAVMESVTPDGKIVDHFDGRMINPGHAIEAAWFLMREGDEREQPEWIELGCKMLDAMWERGWDKDYGGLFYFRDVFDKPVHEYWHEMKFWWPHDEALIATLYAWRLTGAQRYAWWHDQAREWSFAHFGDPEHGEWFGYLRRDGSISSSLKGNLWKSCFHHPRALLWCERMLEHERWP